MSNVDRPKSLVTPSPRWRNFLRRVEGLIELRWPVAAYRLINALILIGLGVLIERASAATALVSFLSYGLVSFIIEYGLAETSTDIERRANEAAAVKMSRLTAELEAYADAEKFLTDRLRRNTGAVSVLRSGDRTLIGAATGSIAKQPAINETLEDLCGSLSAICSKTLNIPRHDAWFRATYMEVEGPANDQKLGYFGWYTLDGNYPKSMSKGVKYIKGEGDAGAAWETGRPVIEDFKSRVQWKENYEHQSANYKSMICVPVVRGYGKEANEVLGVITVDTQVDEYFGKSGDRTQEEKIARLIRPYGTYIAFISAVDGAVSDLLARLDNNAAAHAALAKNDQLAIAPPHESTTTPEANSR